MIEFSPDNAAETPTHQQPINPTIFLAGIIKILWTETGILWRSHLDYNHKTAETMNSPVTLQDNRTKVRALHNLKHMVQEHHRERYFHDDIDSFLEKSTCQQLGHYMVLYEPAIKASLASQTQTTEPPQRPRTNTAPSSARQNQEQGSSNTTAPRGPTPTADRRVNPISSANRITLHPAMAETPYRKQTRIRRLASQVLQQVAARIRPGRSRPTRRQQDHEDDHRTTTIPSTSPRRGSSHHHPRQQSLNDLTSTSEPRQPAAPNPNRSENNRPLIHPALEEAPHRKRTRIRRQEDPSGPNRPRANLFSPSSLAP
jgi:hypothetical protein